MEKLECFKIRLLKGECSDKWNILKLTPILDVLCDHWPFSMNPTIIVADPFLFVHNDRLFLFYEKKRNYSPGVICMTSTVDLVNWSSPIIVLKEDFHLSYPFVFEDNGRIYMIPESSDIGDIRLYLADNDELSHFSFYRTLVAKVVDDSEIGYADSSIYKKDGVYYLMSSIERERNSRNNFLFLFWADNLCGPYYEHPCSPICSSSKYGRNGGSFLESEGGLYRVAQDCESSYGDNIHLFQIDVICKDAYEENLVASNLIPSNSRFFKKGGHQYNFVYFNNSIIVATDAKEYHLFFIYRLLHKIGLIICQLFKKIFP